MHISQQLLARIHLLSLVLLLSFIISCNNHENKVVVENRSDSLTEEQQRLPENALRGLSVATGLEVNVYATEPMLQNPTNIDVDERGRVWVTEAYNYRPDVNGNPTNALGDRIMILEDNNADGKADTAKVFYQGEELNAPLGICVLGNKVIISQSPYVWIFYDDNGDDKADRKEVMFQGVGGDQHDHGAHAFIFGPDGKLYFNFGNAAQTLKDKNGNPVLDQDGDVIGLKKYKQGLVFRCDPDGSNVECLGDNFRNPYEVAVDSYGSLWQSDNDDDGNRGTRINYIVQYGNYGFTDEITGAGWQSSRTNMEDSIPLRHWHLNDPGVVPNLLQTGAGSPTGILVYEGSLLPEQFRGQVIHCDAGPNVVRAYPVKKNGAGYSAEIINILKGEKDPWFRPSDVCVAPDGSLIIADWYDPGVGGHAAGDQVRGRIYRVAPTGTSYKIRKEDFSTASGAVAALQNPNLSVRYHAWTALHEMGPSAVGELEKLWASSADPRMRARAFWVLVKMHASNPQQYIQQAIKDNNPDLRISGIRAASQLDNAVLEVVSALVNDKDMQVLRECALALHHNTSPKASELWAVLATKYDGKDRWYLEALGAAADWQWDKFLAAYLMKVKDPLESESSRNILWRARTDAAVPYIAMLASDKNIALNKRAKYFRAFDFNEGKAKYALLLKMISENKTHDVALNKLVLHALDINTVKYSALAQQALAEVLQSVHGTPEFIQLVSRYEVKSQNKNLLQLAIQNPDKSLGKDAAGLLLQLGGSNLAWEVIQGKDSLQRHNLLVSLSGVGSRSSIDILQAIALSDKYATPIRKQAAGSIGKSWSGEERVLELLKKKKVPAVLIPDVVAGVSGAWRGSIRSEAASYLPASAKSTVTKKAPAMEELQALKADAEEGKKIYASYCGPCHMVNKSGYEFGPGLTEIGSKLPKEALLESIVHPSAGIGFGYEGWEIKMKDGSAFSGILASKTETDIQIKFPGGSNKQIKTSDVKTMTQLKTSMMTDGLHESMSNQNLANLLEYLSTLKKK